MKFKTFLEEQRLVELEEATMANIKKEVQAELDKMSDAELKAAVKKQKTTKPIDHNRGMIAMDVMNAEIKKRGLKEEVEEVEEEVVEQSDKQKAYQEFFEKTLKKYGVKSPSELSDEDKKKFFDEVDAGWNADDE